MHFSPRDPNFRVIRIIFSVPINSDYADFTVMFPVTETRYPPADPLQSFIVIGAFRLLDSSLYVLGTVGGIQRPALVELVRLNEAIRMLYIQA